MKNKIIEIIYKGDNFMKKYKNPEVEILRLVTCDLLMVSGNAPEIDPLEEPNVTPPVSLF